MPVLLLFAFLSGLVTIAAPCVWPLLPVVLTSSSLHGKGRPLGLTLGILVSFGVITLSVSYLVHLIGFDASLLRTFAVVVLAAIGLTLLLPKLGGPVEAGISRFTGGVGWMRAGDGFWAGFVSGLPLGIVWAPCAGPILATIATLAATRDVGVSIVLVTVAYLAGIGLPLALFATAGQHVVQTSRRLSKYTGTLQRVAGFAMIVTAVLVFFDQDTRIEAELLASVPSYSEFVNKLEGNDRVTAELDKLRGSDVQASDKPDLFNKNDAAPELKGITRWLNLPSGQDSLSLAQLRGKVVLIDFWTYTCINCIRTLPHVTAWYDRYKDDGFVVIGVHSPEFVFERETANVESAVQRFGIHYPVAQDNDYGTWKAFRNQYWPAEYLIDKQGNVRRVHFGEGYHAALKLDPKLSLNSFVFGGDWRVEAEYSQSARDSVLEYNFHAQYVYLVMHKPAADTGTVRVLVDGRPVDKSNAGADARNGAVTVDSDRLYELVHLSNGQDPHILRLELSPGIQLYAFTFG